MALRSHDAVRIAARLVFGRIHHSAPREFDGAVHADYGDWIERLAKLFERADGRVELVVTDGMAAN